MTTSSLQHHTERVYGTFFPQVGGVHVEKGGLEVYKVSFSQFLKSLDCPVEE